MCICGDNTRIYDIWNANLIYCSPKAIPAFTGRFYSYEDTLTPAECRVCSTMN